MHCPVCGNEATSVVDTRVTTEGSAIRRRRECDACGYRFSTSEEVEILDVAVVKRDGRRENYSRDKLSHGLKRALEKRPYTDASFRSLLNAIERDIQREKSNELTSSRIGEIVMDRLKTFDKIAYIRFASVYRQFEDVDSFARELKKLEKRPRRRVKKSKESRNQTGKLGI
jgi:transcriptional repressor NrdR